MDEQTEEIISAAEFARRLGVDRSAVRRYVRSGKLSPYSNEYQGLKPQPRFLASDVDRIRAMRGDASEDMRSAQRGAAVEAHATLG